METAAPMRAICIYHHGAYEELPAVGRQLLDYAKAHGLTPQGILRHTYLEGPPQHKDPAKCITQVILPIVSWYFAQRLSPYPPELSPAGTVKSGFRKGRRF